MHDEALALLRDAPRRPARTTMSLFLQGGASMQFALVPMSFLPPGASADYVVTGAWSEKAHAEAAAWAAVVGARGAHRGVHGRRAATPASCGPTRRSSTRRGLRALHQQRDHPRRAVPRRCRASAVAPQVCDMSSDFLWRKIDVDAVLAHLRGAQKNIGPSGVTVVIARSDSSSGAARTCRRSCSTARTPRPTRCSTRRRRSASTSMRNVLVWLKGLGGLAGDRAAQPREGRRALRGHRRAPGLLPVPGRDREPLGDERGLPPAERGAREEVRRRGQEAGMVGLKGHRSVGGIRVSLYNAVEPAWVARARVVHEGLRQPPRLKRTRRNATVWL